MYTLWVGPKPNACAYVHTHSDTLRHSARVHEGITRRGRAHALTSTLQHSVSPSSQIPATSLIDGNQLHDVTSYRNLDTKVGHAEET